jgi:hypothetical protein
LLGLTKSSSRIAALHAMLLFIFAILILLSAPKQCSSTSRLNYTRFLARAAATTVHLAHFNSPAAAAHAIHRLECSRQECLSPASGKLERKGMVLVCPLPADLTIRMKAISSVKINVCIFSLYSSQLGAFDTGVIDY